MMCRFVSILLLSTGLITEGYAQLNTPLSNPPDSGSRVKPRVQSYDQYNGASNGWKSMDTAFDYVHRYAPLTLQEHAWQDLGHAGAPAKSLLPVAISNPGLRSGFEAYRMLLKAPLDLVYSAQNPFTRFHYTQGGQGLIGLQALHTQNITPGWNMTIDYHSLQSQGLYEHSAHKQRNIQTASHYRSRNGRFLNRTTATWNRFQRNEHWGLRDTARLFSEQPSIFIPRNSAANSSYLHTNHQMHNSYALAKKGAWSKLQLVNQLRFTRERFEYEDRSTPDTFYSRTLYYQMNGCADSFYLREAAAEAGWMYSNQQSRHDTSRHWNATLLGGASDIRAGAYRAVPGRYHNTWLRGSMGYGLPDGTQNTLQLSAIRYFSGYNAGDYLVNMTGRLVKDQRYAGFQWMVQSSRAAFTDQFYFSKHYSWNNSFKPLQSNEWRINAGIKTERHLMEVHYRSGTLKGLVYMNSAFAPVQTDETISYGDLSLNTQSDWKHFYLRSSLHFMGSSNSKAMPVPTFCGTHSLGYKGVWFDGVLRIRAGFDVWWYSRFNGYGYHPASGRFYVQQQLQTGAYPLLDFFVNGEVKSLQFFVKMEHLNQGWYPPPGKVPYWSAAGYAFEPRRFRLGLRWAFYN
jgi:hypothetical protein